MQSGNLGDIVAFVETVNHDNFAGAARALRLSRSAVAKAVARLEKRLGARLLRRTTRSVSVTEEGARFHEQCAAILGALAAAENGVTADATQPKGILRITAPTSYGSSHVLPVVHRFLDAWPDVSVEMSLTDRVTEIVEEGFDLAIRIDLPAQLPKAFIARLVGRYRTMLCASPAYLRAHGAPKTLDALRDHVCLQYTSSRARAVPWRVPTTKRSWRTLEGRMRFRADSGDAVLEAALLGMGIAFLPSFMCERHVRDGRLVPVLTRAKTGELPVFALYPSKRHLPATVRAFLDALVKART